MARLRNISPVAALLLAAASGTMAQSTSFTYQGELKSSGQLANGLHDMRFKLFNAATGGAQVGSTVCVDNILVAGGKFVAQVDFGQQYVSSSPRYLEIDVRADTGLDCSNLTGFVTLSTRQLLTSVPMAAHANSAFALDAPGGSILNSVFVSSGGLVGINTTSPNTNLTVAGDMEMGTSSGDYRHFRIGGGNCSGFLYGSYPRWGDGIHMGYNYYADASGTDRIIATDGQTSRVSMGYGYVSLATGTINQVPVDRLIVDQAGNVMTSSGASPVMLLTPGGNENLRIIRGVVNDSGGVISGAGFHVVKGGTGSYQIWFDPSLGGIPTVTVTPDDGLVPRVTAATHGFSQNQALIETKNQATGGLADSSFSFIVMAPR